MQENSHSNSSNLISNSLTWLSSKVKKIINKSQQQKVDFIVSKNQNQCKCHQSPLSKKTKQQIKEIVLMKMRKPSSQNDLNLRLKKIKEYMQKKSEFQKPLQLVCPICIDMFIKPIITICGHTFCYCCLDEALLFNPVCPVCRTNIRGYDFTVCKSLNQIILRYLQKYQDQSYYNAYDEKLKDFQIWISKRNLSPQKLKLNDSIDVRDTQFIWCKATINEIYKKKNKVTGILVHYMGWNSVYDQIIDINSQRLASYKFYSSRFDIPHYHLNQQVEDNMYSYVVIGQPLQPLPIVPHQNFQNLERYPIQDDYYFDMPDPINQMSIDQISHNINFNFNAFNPTFFQNQIIRSQPQQQQYIDEEQIQREEVQLNRNNRNNENRRGYIDLTHYLPLDYMMLNSDDQEQQQFHQNQQKEDSYQYNLNRFNKFKQDIQRQNLSIQNDEENRQVQISLQQQQSKRFTKENPQDCNKRHSLLKQQLQKYKKNKKREKYIQKQNEKFLESIMSIKEQTSLKEELKNICQIKNNQINQQINENQKQIQLEKQMQKEDEQQQNQQHSQYEMDIFKLKMEEQYFLRSKIFATQKKQIVQQQKQDKNCQEKSQCTFYQYSLNKNSYNQ